MSYSFRFIYKYVSLWIPWLKWTFYTHRSQQFSGPDATYSSALFSHHHNRHRIDSRTWYWTIKKSKSREVLRIIFDWRTMYIVHYISLMAPYRSLNIVCSFQSISINSIHDSFVVFIFSFWIDYRFLIDYYFCDHNNGITLT